MTLFDYTEDKLSEPGFWGLVVIVGLAINGYGQILVPWLRGISPARAIREEARQRPRLLALSIFVAFLFPFLVALASGVATRYGQRDVEARASFPDEKPDPVLRVDEDGRIVQMGHNTSQLLKAHPAEDAPALLGEAAWETVLAAHHDHEPLDGDLVVEYAGTHYLVAYSSSEAFINLYLARLAPGSCLSAPE